MLIANTVRCSKRILLIANTTHSEHCSLQSVLFAVSAHCSQCSLQSLLFAVSALCSQYSLQSVLFAISALCSQCSLQSVLLAVSALCSQCGFKPRCTLARRIRIRARPEQDSKARERHKMNQEEPTYSAMMSATEATRSGEAEPES